MPSLQCWGSVPANFFFANWIRVTLCLKETGSRDLLLPALVSVTGSSQLAVTVDSSNSGSFKSSLSAHPSGILAQPDCTRSSEVWVPALWGPSFKLLGCNTVILPASSLCPPALGVVATPCSCISVLPQCCPSGISNSPMPG